jgi:APA family basic amino acid/polyamine antiporter
VVLAVTGSFERLAIFANIAALALYFGCAVASWRLRPSTPLGLGTVIPWLACGVILWLLLKGVTLNEWLAFWACVAVASLLYALTRGQRN